MRRDRDEVRPQLIELHRLLVKLRSLDRKRDPVSDQLQQVDFLRCEPAVNERADVDHAQRFAGDKKWHAEHRLDSLLAQDWVEHVGVIDVVEDHRLPVRPRSRPAKPRPTGIRTPRSTSSSIPTAARATSSLARSSSEEHRAGVRVEDVANAGKKHREQVVELKMRERRIRDGLHVLDPLPRTALRLEGSRMLDRHRCTVAGELQQLHIILVEPPVHQRPDVEDAEHAAADEQRHTEHRLDPLLAQNRIEDVGVIDVIEDDRLPVRRDPARETKADRDPNAAFNLFLDPDRGPRDELVRLLVQQQERASIDTENLAGAQKQRREESVKLQVRERRIRERLKLPQTVRVLDAIPLRQL